MSAVTVEELTPEVAAELSDQELQALADGDDEGNAKVAKATLSERQAEFADRKAQEVKGEAGEPTGEMQKEVAPPEPQEPVVDEILVDGTTELEQLGLFEMGGKKPTRASIKFTGGKVKLVAGTAFRKGDRIRFSGEAVVNDVGQKDDHDPKTSQVVDCEQRHGARIIDLVVDSAS